MTQLIFSGKEIAPAKINLSLKVLEHRSDNYHNLESLMVTVDLCDQLSLFLYKSDKSSWRVSSDRSDLPQNENNIAYKAARAFFKWYEINPDSYSLNLEIVKNIPSQAGLGGGSADAAATLRLLERAFFADDNFEAMPLSYMAHEIGADVPYCYTSGTCFVRGIGDIIEEFPAFPQLPLILFKPPISISTKHAFAALNTESKANKPVNRSSFKIKYSEIIAEKSYSDFSLLLENSFLPNVKQSYPKINDYMNALTETKSPFVSLSGTGPTLFALYEENADVDVIAKSLSKKFPETLVFKNKIVGQDSLK